MIGEFQSGKGLKRRITTFDSVVYDYDDMVDFGTDVSAQAPEAVRKPTRAVAIATMAAALRRASAEMGHPVDDTLLALMLGQMLGAEGAMPGLWQGGGYTLRGTNNIGAAQVLGGAAGKAFAAAKAAIGGWGAFAHKDSNPGGDEYIGWYYMAPSALEAARHWLTGFAGTKAVLAQNPRTPEDYARIMYRSGYFTGLSHDAEKEIAAYAKRIRGAMPPVSVMNGPANDPSAVSVDPSQFDTLEKRKITKALFDKAKSGKSGSAWSFLLPASWDDLVQSNGVVWFGKAPVAGTLIGVSASTIIEMAAWVLGGAVLGGIIIPGMTGVVLGAAGGGIVNLYRHKEILPTFPALTGAVAPMATASTSTPTFDLRSVQAKLNALGVAAPPLKVDGIIGPKTTAAIIAFQRKVGLPADGVLSPSTLKTLGG